MMVYSIGGQQMVNSKLDQLKTIGLSSTEYEGLSDILYSSVSCVSVQRQEQNIQLWNSLNLPTGDSTLCSYQTSPETIAYSLPPNAVSAYSTSYYGSPIDQAGYTSTMFQNAPMNYSKDHSGCDSIGQNSPTHASSSAKESFSLCTLEQAKLESKKLSNAPLHSKVALLQKVLDGIKDDQQVLITSKPKNRSQKIRKSNRHSVYRGVSLNGKKWQVMIMGSIKKKYFGGIKNERDAAIFYDKLSILTNGLAAKTNFNYRKSDLERILPELERMAPLVFN